MIAKGNKFQQNPKMKDLWKVSYSKLLLLQNSYYYTLHDQSKT